MTDKGLEALEKYHKELVEDNPRYATLLARAATEAYIANTERDGSPKSSDAGKNIYDAMFNCLKGCYVPEGNFDEYSEKVRQQMGEMIRENLGINIAVLEDLMGKGINFTAFYEGIVKASVGNFNKRLDKLSENGLTPDCITESAKKYLVERAKKLELKGLEGITEDAINSIDDFKYIAKMIVDYKRRS